MLRYSLYHHSPQAMRNTLYYRPLQRLDSPTDRKNPLVQSLLSGQILPVTGTFFPQTCLQKSRFFQPLEESSRSKPAQRPKTSSQWRNHPAYRPLCVLILTATGGIRTQKAIDLTVRMDFHGTSMRSCGVHRRGSGGTFTLGRPPVFAAMRLRYGGWDCCEPKRKKLRGAHTGNDTMGAAPVPASPSPSTRDEVARSENLPEPYRGPSRAIVAPQVRPPARPARENGGFPTPPQEKDRREE